MSWIGNFEEKTNLSHIYLAVCLRFQIYATNLLSSEGVSYMIESINSKQFASEEESQYVLSKNVVREFQSMNMFTPD